MAEFTQETTQGYTDKELAILNSEWDELVEVESLELFSDEYYDRESEFHDEVARRYYE